MTVIIGFHYFVAGDFKTAVTLICITWTLLFRGMSHHFKKTGMCYTHILVAYVMDKKHTGMW